MLVPEELTVDDAADLLGADTNHIRKLATGGQKQVFIWDDGAQKIVVKFIQFRFRDTDGHGSTQFFDDIIERTDREIGLMTQVQSPHLPTINEHIYLPELNIGHGTFIVYCEDYIGPTTVRDLISAGTLQESEVIKIITNVASAIRVYWESPAKIVHRDIKPENIVLSETTGDYVLIDSGVHFSSQNTSVSIGIVGTRPYFSPEQVDGERNELDARSDMYSLGLVAHEALTGSHPYFDLSRFHELSSEQIRHDILTTKPAAIADELAVSDSVKQLVARLLSKRKFYRPRTPEILLQLTERSEA